LIKNLKERNENKSLKEMDTYFNWKPIV